MKITEIIDPSLVKIFTGVDIDSKGNVIDKPSGDSNVSTVDTGGTSDTDSGKIVVVGDSLAVGTGSQIPGAIVDAKVGISSKAVLDKAINNKSLQGADLAIISAGANDGAGPNGKNPNSQQTIANLQAIRKALGAKKYVWIVPYNKSVADDIKSVAGSDEVVELSKTVSPSKDGVHPSSYGSVAKDAISKGGVKPNTGKKGGNGNVSKGGSIAPSEVQSYLLGKMDRNHAAGIMANIKHESGFKPGVIGDGGTSGGLFQHHASRFTAMVNACGGKGNWQSNWKGQIDFALSEPAGQQYLSQRFSSPEQATKWWTMNFEKPANMVAQANIRSQSASQYA